MRSWEMNQKAEKGITNKLAKYHGVEQEKEIESKYSSYEQARDAEDTQAMIGFKMDKLRSKGAGVIALSNEYAKLPISEIQSRIKSSEAMLEKAKDNKERLYEQQYKRFEKEFSKIGGCVGVHLEMAIYDAMEDYVKNDEEYLEAVKEYNTLRTEARALKNAKEIYIEDHKDMIEAERRKAEREALLASGILEELGIKKQEA